jgi:hypothetical protein
MMKINGIRVHPDITAETIIEAVERRRTSLDNPGICILCGIETEGVEPDARNYHCEACGADQVFGVEELLIRLF